MSEPGRWLPAAELAAKHPPRSLESFDLAPITPPPGPDWLVWAEFLVSCKACKGDVFHVGTFPLVAPSPSPFHQVEPGATLHRPPHQLRCAACGETATVFDARTDGYDGILCGGGPYESGETGETFTERSFRIQVTPCYNISLEELEELAAEAPGGVKPSDLFDWLSIWARPTDDGPSMDLSYQCS